MCQQTTLGFCVSLKETSSNATTFTVINKYWKGAVIQIATVFRPISVLFVLVPSRRRLFRHLSNHIFQSQYFRKYISYEDHVFLVNV